VLVAARYDGLLSDTNGALPTSDPERKAIMARALWNGAISFGLVNVPVELYSAEDRKSFEFSMLDKRDLSPVGYKRYNKKSGKEVDWSNVIKGYEYEKDQYVVLSDEDFRRANVKATQTIDILAFVPADEIPYEYFETPYYLAPAGRGQKVYALLRETMLATSRIAVAQVVIRTTQHLAAVVVNGNALMLNTLRYQDELRDATGIELPAGGLKAAGVTAKEVELAKRLIQDMSGHWNPADYKDTYHADLMARIKQKIKQGETKQITEPGKDEGPARRTAQVIDLAELLKKSLDRGKEGNGTKRKAAVARGKPALRVVPATRGAAKNAAKRKRA
jgi:DNA end-binding protein Ku